MSFFFKIICTAILFTFTTILKSQTQHTVNIEYKKNKLPFGLEEKVPKNKPIVALALSGGGARGLAQIGVLKALEEAGIDLDIIVGTSMGSIIGGLYAAGYSVDQLDSIAENTNWNDLLSLEGETDRDELFIDQKITEDKAILTLRLDGLSPIIPTSINTGHRLSNYLNLLTLQAPVHVEKNFDDFKVKFRAICTDLITGNEVVLDKGSLSQAMRASSSVSFFLPPVKMDSLILVDGGLVANIPVKIALDMGADIVIAVNTTSELHPKENLDLPWVIADQIISIPMKLLNENQLSQADFVILPSDTNRSPTDFTNIDSIIFAGYKNTLVQINAMKSKIDSVFAQTLSGKERYFKNIKNHESIFPWETSLLNKYAKVDSVSEKEIKRDIYSIYKTGGFKSIKSVITQEENYTEISFVPELNSVIKKIDCSGISILDKTQVDGIIKNTIGKTYDGVTVYSLIVDILSQYRAEGYSLASLREMRFNEYTGRLSLSFDEGIVSDISVEGNESTNPTVITREFPIKAGDYFRYPEVSEGLTNLRSTNLFEDLILTVKKTNDRNTIVIRVIEKTSGLLRVGFRVDDERKAQISLDIRDENLFGTGTELGLLFFGGTRNRAYVLEHKSNRVFNTYLTYKINAYYQFQDVFVYSNSPTTSDKTFSRIVDGEYRQIYYGASVAVGSQVEKFGNLIFKGKYQFDEVKNIDSTHASPSPEKIKVVSLKISATIDSQDRYPYPRRGIYFNGSYESATSFLGGDVGFINLGFDYKSYFTINNIHTFSPRIMMGFGDKTLPLGEQYSLGGQNSFFGMRENEYRGRQIFLSSFQYTVQMPFEIFFNTYVSFRYDIGSTWEFQEQIRFKDLKQGIGTTVSFDTPIGPADFSVGRSFLYKKNLPGSPISWGDVNFYFSIGYFY